MKSTTTLLVIVALLASSAGAQCDGWFCNMVGIYFDESGICNEGRMPPNVPVPAYLVFTRMNAATINAWEIALECHGVTLVSLGARHPHITVSPRPGEYMCGLAQPQLVAQGIYIAADLMIMAPTLLEGKIIGDGVTFHLLPNRAPCYTDERDVPYELTPVGWGGNGRGDLCYVQVPAHPCVVADETQAFGAVKSLFR